MLSKSALFPFVLELGFRVTYNVVDVAVSEMFAKPDPILLP
tara:strand:+ start:1006 stop:1128 length:123 start_codon:yes stop_codon:yes gene_type:complete